MPVVLRSQSRLRLEGRTRTLSRPSPDLRRARVLAPYIKMARRVTHKNVCRIHEYGQDGGLQYISMAYVDGVDLKHVIRQQGGLTADDAFLVRPFLPEVVVAPDDAKTHARILSHD